MVNEFSPTSVLGASVTVPTTGFTPIGTQSQFSGGGSFLPPAQPGGTLGPNPQEQFSLPVNPFRVIDSLSPSTLDFLGNTFGFEGLSSTGAVEGVGFVGTPAFKPTSLGGTGGTGATGSLASSATTAFASAGASFVGSFLSQSIFGGKETGSNIGGAVGGAIGAFVGGPVGAGVGSFIGSALGGIFGPGGVPTIASEFITISNQEGTDFNRDFGSKRANTEFAEGISGAVDKMLALMKENGVDTSDIKIRGGLNTVQAGGGFLDFGTRGQSDEDIAINRITFDPNDQSTFETAIEELGDAILGQAGDNRQLADLIETNQETGGRTRSGVPLVTRRGTSFREFLDRFQQQQPTAKA